MTKKGSTAKIAAIIVAVMLCVAILTTVLVACNNNTITFETNGGTPVESVKKSIDKSPKTTRDGYDFDGWYADKEFKTAKIEFPYEAKGNVTLYAKWVEESTSAKIGKAITKISDALSASLGFVGSQPFGIDINLAAMGVGINFKANVDAKDLSKVAANLQIMNGDAVVADFFADDEFLYAVGDSFKKRFKDLRLADMLGGAGLDKLDTNAYTSFIGLGLNMILDGPNATYSEDGNSYEIENNLAGIVNLLTEIPGIPEIPATVTDILASLNLRLNAAFNDDGSLKDIIITIVSPVGDIAVSSDSLKMGNGVEPTINLPSKTDATFDETYGLNFSLTGTVKLNDTKSNFTTSNLVTFDYEVLVDYNLFGVLRDSFGNNGKGVNGLFGDAAQDSRIYINVYHKCNQYCGSFCDSKIGDSRGSFITLAYSPEDFDSNNFFVSINPQYLFPKGMLDYVAGLGSGLDALFTDNFGEYLALTLDPSAIIASLTNENSAYIPVAEAAGIDIGSLLNPNVLQIVADVFDFVKGINLNADSLTLDTNALLGLIDTIAHTDATNIATILQMLFTDKADTLSISTTALYGVPAIAETDMYHKFMTISDEIGEYKNFVGKSGANFTPAKSIEWEKDANGNVVLSADGIINYDSEGKALNLSAPEVETLLTKGKASYSYTKLNGETGKSTAAIMSVIGLDYTKLNVPQTVTVLTEPADGNTFAGILGLLSGLVPGLSIPGSMFTTTVTISEIESLTITQPDDLLYKYDPNHEYVYNEDVNVAFTATVIYKDGSKKEVKNIRPTNASQFMNGNAKFGSFGNETMVFNVFGTTITKEIKAATMYKDKVQLIDNNKVIEETRTVGASIYIDRITTDYNGRGQINNPDYDPNGPWDPENNPPFIDADIKMTTSIMAYEGVTKVTGEIDPSITVSDSRTASGKYNGIKFTFNKAGTFEIPLYVSKGVSRVYKVTVTEAPLPVPGYKATANYTDGKTIDVVMGRTSQIGGNISATLKVKIGQKDLTVGTDYVIEGIEGNNVFLNANQVVPQKFIIKLVNPELIKDSIYATIPAMFTFTTTDGRMICESGTPENLFADYSLTSAQFAANDINTGNALNAIQVIGKVSDANRIHSAADTFKIKFEIKAEGATDYTEATPTMGIYLPDYFAIADTNTVGPLALDFTNDGTIFNAVMGGSGYLCFIVDNTASFDYKITVTVNDTATVVASSAGTYTKA